MFIICLQVYVKYDIKQVIGRVCLEDKGADQTFKP
jgi:hypothetical protein